jgi:hypothetical protein
MLIIKVYPQQRKTPVQPKPAPVSPLQKLIIFVVFAAIVILLFGTMGHPGPP